MAALMLAEAPCDGGVPPRAPPRARPRAEKKLFSLGQRAQLMSRICSTLVARFSAACHVVKVLSLILRYTREGMPLRSSYPEQSAGPLNSAENSAAAAVKAASSLKGVVTPCTPIYTNSCHRIGVGEGASGSPCRGWLQEKTLSASGGMEDTAGVEAAVVALRWSNFKRSECSSSLSAELAVKAPKKVRVWREISSRLTWIGDDSLRKSGAGGDRAKMLRGGSRRKGAAGAEWVLSLSDCLVARLILRDQSGCPIWARLLLATVESRLRAVWEVDVDEILRVECVNLALTGSHDGWGKDGEEPKPRIHEDKYRPLKCSVGNVCTLSTYRNVPYGCAPPDLWGSKGQEVETEVPRAAEAGLYTGEDKGRLCALDRVQLGTATPFTDEAAFLKAFKARFGNLDDTAAAQVELTKLCADRTMHKKCTAAEFLALFKGPADCSGYGNLELRDKYLSGIPSRVYQKIELETFATWQEANTHATAVEQILDVSWARWPELNNFFSARGQGRGYQKATQGAVAQD
ncbi:predicted protein [Postia placenta Mad-698-R]|nr:predicted protein [Postia placenta Mad-698-R]